MKKSVAKRLTSHCPSSTGITLSILLVRGFAYKKRYLSFLHTSRFPCWAVFVMALIFVLLSFHFLFTKNRSCDKWKLNFVDAAYLRHRWFQLHTLSELSKYGAFTVLFLLILTYSDAVILRDRNEFVTGNA